MLWRSGSTANHSSIIFIEINLHALSISIKKINQMNGQLNEWTIDWSTQRNDNQNLR